MLEDEREKLAHAEDELKKRVVGQPHAIGAVVSALKRARAGLSDEARPFGSFMFLGPTGVGKTELARALSEFMFNDEKALVQIDMSEYMERHSVARLIGSPPGYVGYEEGGQLTETVRHKPYSLILFDEIEKAHPEAFNLLLQVLDSGRLTDGKGRTINFKNTIIIMTSNVGSEYFKEMSTLGFEIEDENAKKQKTNIFKERVMEDLKDSFRPEFLNRLDDIIIFDPLTKKDIEKIVEIWLARVEAQLKARGIKVAFDKSLRKYLSENGFDPEYGARPLRRLIQKTVVDAIADKIIKGELKNAKQITVLFSEPQGVSVALRR